MRTVIDVENQAANRLGPGEPLSLTRFELLASAVGGVARLRELVLEFAIQGRLGPQDSSDEPASTVVAKADVQKDSHGTKKPLPRQLNRRDSSALPVGWCWSSLGEIGMISPRNAAPDEIQASFVQMSSIPVAMMEPHATETRQWGDIKSGFTHFAEGDVGAAKITPCFENGKSTVFRGLSNGIGAGTTELHVVRPLAGVVPEYILAFLKSPRFLRNGEAVMTGSAGQKRMPRAYFESTPFPLPPLAEQHRIVTRVEELMKLCDALVENGRLADEQHARLVSTLFDALASSESSHELFENWQRLADHFDLLLDRPEAIDALERTVLQLAVSGLLVPQDHSDELGRDLLNRMQRSRIARRNIIPPSSEAVESFSGSMPKSWAWASIDQISADDERAITDGPFGANLKTEHYIDRPGYRIVRLQNIGRGEFRDEHRAYVEKARFDELIKHQVLAGDLVVAGLIDTSIRCCVVPNGIGPAIVKADCYRLSVHPLVSARYVLHYLNSATAHEFAAVHHHGLTLTRIGLGNFRSIPVPLPPLAEQHRIVARVDELRGLCVDLRGRLTETRDVQTALADALVADVLC